MAWEWAALMPHPPIIVPEVGGDRAKPAAATTAGIRETASCIGASGRPDCLLVLSPHQPYVSGALSVNATPRAVGGFARFGAPQIAFDLATADAGRLTAHLRDADVRSAAVFLSALHDDQGATVPLYFLREVWDVLPPVVLCNPAGLTRREALSLGRALAAYEDGQRWGLLASGDLSHRLRPDAPAGYSPDGEAFDRAVVAALADKNPESLVAMPERTVGNAGECGLRSVLTMLGLCGERAGEIAVLSYEGPFGVGYCNALWRKG